MITIKNFDISEVYPSGSIGDVLVREGATASVEMHKGRLVVHVKGKGAAETLIKEDGNYEYYVSEDLVDLKEKVIEFIDQHPSLFVFPLIDTCQTRVMSALPLGGGKFGRVYEVNRIALDNLIFSVNLVLKIPSGEERSEESISSEIQFIHELHRRFSKEERKKFFPDVHEVTYMRQRGYLAERFDGNLEDYLFDENPSVEERIEIAHQLIEQMALLSKYNAIYTDGKLKNVLIKKHPLKVVLADFGDCWFLDKRPRNREFAATFAMRNDPLFDRTCKTDEKLMSEVDAHSARSLGLMLCHLFEGVPISSKNYSKRELAEYFNSSLSLIEIYKKDPLLYDVIGKLLGFNGGCQLKPLQAWKWSQCQPFLNELLKKHTDVEIALMAAELFGKMTKEEAAQMDADALKIKWNNILDASS